MSETTSNAPDANSRADEAGHDSLEIADWLRLTETPGIGPLAIRRLLAEFGPPGRVLAAGRAALRQHIQENVVSALLAPISAPLEALIDATLAWARLPGNHFITLADARYPIGLLAISDPPPVLYVKGRVELLNSPQIAVVGSRNATAQGLENATRFAQVLAEHGLTITSGLAQGIDGAAHTGAMQAREGATLAVIGTGADIVYPARHRALAHKIAECGVIVSEFPLGAPPRTHHFPRRNRLIAGLSSGILVVEAAAQSGSLITARLAGDYGKEVFAIPGSIHSPLSKGCHQLIKQGAKLVESAADILDELPTWSGRASRMTASDGAARARPAAGFDDPVLAAVSHDPVHFDTLQQRTGQEGPDLSARLLELELAGHIDRLPGDRFILARS